METLPDSPCDETHPPPIHISESLRQWVLTLPDSAQERLRAELAGGR